MGIFGKKKKEITFKCKCGNTVTTTKYSTEEDFDPILRIKHITYSIKCPKCKEKVFKYETVRGELKWKE